MTRPPAPRTPKPPRPPRGIKARADGEQAPLQPHELRMHERGQGVAEDQRGQDQPADKRRALKNR